MERAPPPSEPDPDKETETEAEIVPSTEALLHMIDEFVNDKDVGQAPTRLDQHHHDRDREDHVTRPERVKLMRNFLGQNEPAKLRDGFKVQNGPAGVSSAPDPASRVLDVRKESPSPPSPSPSPSTSPSPTPSPPLTPPRECDDLSPEPEEHGDGDGQKSGPKVTIKPLVPPPIDKMTIKISRDRQDETTYKLEQQRDEAEECPQVPKLTIKIPPERGFSPDGRRHSPSVPKLIIRASGRQEDGHPPTHEVLSPSIGNADSERENSVADGGTGDPSPRSETVDPERSAVPKLTIKQIPVPENYQKPLEVVTSVNRLPESGQHSPRIILKINKTDHGSTSEIVTAEREDACQSREPTVPKLTIRIPQEVESERVDAAEPEQISPLGKIKLKLTREGSRATIVNDVQEERENCTDETGVKRVAPESEENSLANDSDDRPDPKKIKLDQIFNSSGLNAKKLTNSKRHRDGDVFDERSESVKNNNDNVSSSDLNSVISDRVKRVPSKNGSSKLQDILLNFHSQKERKQNDRILDSDSVCEKPEIVSETNSNTSSDDSSEDLDNFERANRPESPVFDKVDDDLIGINEGSNSQGCMLVDELSQDPLDIESAAKGHFAPVSVVNADVAEIKSDIIDIMGEKPMQITPSPFTPRKRGRPRKTIAPEDKKPPGMVTQALDERPVRKSRILREKPLILQTPRRGRGRGAKRGSLNSSPRVSSDMESPVELAHSFFLNMSDKKLNSVNCEIKLPRLLQEPLSSDNDMKSPREDTDEEFEILNVSARGRGRGRGGRGGRGRGRGRGGATPRGRGGKGGRPPKRKTLMGFEEVQLQDALPIVSLKRDKKSKMKRSMTPSLDVFEEETCMIGDNIALNRNATLIDDESQSSLHSGIVSESSKSKRPKVMDMLDEGHKEWKASDIAEYDWPPESSFTDAPQTFMIQEQVALFLGIKSFKRRYPDLKRRPLSAEEKNYIMDRGLLSEAMCDLGVTAVDAGEILDIMYTDFPRKYEEYRKHLRERRDKPKGPPQINTEKSKQETLEKAVESASSWNAQLNKQRLTARSAAFDLQSLTLHQPRKPQAVQPRPTNISYYPVALLTGQYTDFCRYYTPEELKCYPLNTILELPPSPPPPHEETSSDEMVGDSDGESVGGSISDSSELVLKKRGKGKGRGTATGGESNSGFGSLSRPASPSQTISGAADDSNQAPIEVPRCKLCSGTEHCNRKYPQETFVICATCHKKIHPSCLDMSQNVAKVARTYAWQCVDCKCCGECEDLADDDKMLFCDLCDRGYHIYCVGLKKVPTGRWHCKHCALCKSCGSRSPSGIPGGPGYLENPVVPEQWHHHLKKNNTGMKVYSFTLCSPCARSWRAGRYCPACEKCFTGKKGAMRLVICVTCDRAFHQECVRRDGKVLDILRYKCNRCRRGNPPPKKPRGGYRTFGSRRSNHHRSRNNDFSDSNQSNSIMDQNDSSSESEEDSKLDESIFNDESKSELFNEEDSIDSMTPRRPIKSRLAKSLIENLDETSRQSSSDVETKSKLTNSEKPAEETPKNEDLPNCAAKSPLRSECTLNDNKSIKTNISQLPNVSSDEPQQSESLESAKCVLNNENVENSDKKPLSDLAVKLLSGDVEPIMDSVKSDETLEKIPVITPDSRQISTE